jgi:DNA-binding response OmpR family regulator
MRILISEDQLQLRSILKKRLKEDGFSVDDVEDGEEAMSFLTHTDYDVIILDIMMPKVNGLDVLKFIRNQKMETPVILLTAKDKISDKIQGLNEGADDYVVKPFAYEELKARIHALLRRQHKVIENILKVSNLTLNRTTKIVKRGEDIIHLSKKEYAILEYLMLHKGEVISRERLEQSSTDFDYEGYSNVIDVYIRFLRKKIDQPYQKDLIQTVRGFGYKIEGDNP